MAQQGIYFARWATLVGRIVVKNLGETGWADLWGIGNEIGLF